MDVRPGALVAVPDQVPAVVVVGEPCSQLPATAFRDGLLETVAWYEEHGVEQGVRLVKTVIFLKMFLDMIA